MKTKLYIPKEIRVGYQNREDTFTKKLAYVVYVDDKGVLRKERSWNSWCDDEIEKHSFQNEPTSGFMLNKNVTRYNWGYFSSDRSYIRVHDPRGFEFEISPENLIGILMSDNCNRRILEGSYVYSWHGTELVLLPTTSEDYEASKSFTDLQATTLSAKDLVEGRTYRTKKEVDYVYIGRFNWYERNSYNCGSGNKGKKHVFFNPATLTRKAEEDIYGNAKHGFETFSSTNSFSKCVDDQPHVQFAKIMDKFSKLSNVKKIASLDFQSVDWTAARTVKEKWAEAYNFGFVINSSDDSFALYSVLSHRQNNRKQPLKNISDLYDDDRYRVNVTHFKFVKGSVEKQTREYSSGYHKYSSHEERLDVKGSQLKALGFKTLTIKYEDGTITKPMLSLPFNF